MSLETMQNLMKEIGPLTDEILSIGLRGENQWEVVLEDEILMVIDYAEEAHKLTFSLNVGTPPEGDRMALYEALLTQNALWQETGGMHAALEGPGGDVLMVFDLFALELDVSELSTVIGRLIQKQTAWREAISKFGQASTSGDSDGPSDGPFDPSQSLRV